MWRPGWGCSGNPNQRRFRPLGDVPLFEKMLSINGLGDILAVESGYEEGCRWGATLKACVKANLMENLRLAFLFLLLVG